MNNTKRIRSIFITLFILISAFMSLTLSASAQTSGSGPKTGTIYVTTKANYLLPGQSSITISQTAGTMYSNPAHTGTFSQYGYYKIVATPQSGSSTSVVRTALSGSSVKINLAANTVYKVTVSWDSCAPQNIVGTSWWYTGCGWKTYPSWRVSGSWKCTYY